MVGIAIALPDTTVLQYTMEQYPNASKVFYDFRKTDYYYNGSGWLDSSFASMDTSQGRRGLEAWESHKRHYTGRDFGDILYTWRGTTQTKNRTTTRFFGSDTLLDSICTPGSSLYTNSSYTGYSQKLLWDSKGRQLLDSAWDWTLGGGMAGASYTVDYSYRWEWNDAEHLAIKHYWRKDYRMQNRWRVIHRDSMLLDDQGRVIRSIFMNGNFSTTEQKPSNRYDYFYDTEGKLVLEMWINPNADYNGWKDSCTLIKYSYDANKRLLLQENFWGTVIDSTRVLAGETISQPNHKIKYVYQTITPASIQARPRTHWLQKGLSSEYDLLGRRHSVRREP